MRVCFFLRSIYANNIYLFISFYMSRISKHILIRSTPKHLFYIFPQSSLKRKSCQIIIMVNFIVSSPYLLSCANPIKKTTSLIYRPTQTNTVNTPKPPFHVLPPQNTVTVPLNQCLTFPQTTTPLSPHRQPEPSNQFQSQPRPQ